MKIFGTILAVVVYLFSAAWFLWNWVQGDTQGMIGWGVLLLLNQATINYHLKDE